MLGDNRLKIIVVIVIVAIIAVFSIDPIAQDPGYHNFADQRSMINIPNFYNVLSNLPFIIIGIAGMRLVASGQANRRTGRVAKRIPGIFCRRISDRFWLCVLPLSS